MPASGVAPASLLLLLLAAQADSAGAGVDGECPAPGAAAAASSGCGAARLCSELREGERLAQGEWLTSLSGAYVAVLDQNRIHVSGAGELDARWQLKGKALAEASLSDGQLLLKDESGGVAWRSGPPRGCSVTLFQHGRLDGHSAVLGEGEYTREKLLAVSAFKATDTSSLRVSGAGCTVTLFGGPSFDGWAASFAWGSYDLAAMERAGAKNDAVNSVKVKSTMQYWAFSDAAGFELSPGEEGIERRRGSDKWVRVAVKEVDAAKKRARVKPRGAVDEYLEWVDLSSGVLRKRASAGPSRMVLTDDGELTVRAAQGVLWSSAADAQQLPSGQQQREDEDSEEARHLKAMARCAEFFSCGECVEADCGWCLGRRECVADVPWICQGDQDHASRPGSPRAIGKGKCPTREQIEEDHRVRRQRAEAAAAAASLPASDIASSLGAAGASSVAPGGADNGSSARADGNASDNEDADFDPALVAELLARARFAEEDQGTRPYKVLNVSRKASSSEIRKAYRRLSMRFHPDKWARARKAWRESAEKAFGDIQRAYETIGAPDKRAAFDSFDGEDFNRQWEDDSKKEWQGGENFYFGDPLIATLTEELWEKRLAGQSIWLIEFYAAWCPHCRNTRHLWRESARKVENLSVEVGAVNCVRQKKICVEYIGVKSYPTIRLVNREFGMIAEYKPSDPGGWSDLPGWVQKISSEWRWLFRYAKVHTDLGPVDFAAGGNVTDSPAMWIVAFIDGRECQPCKAMCTNLLRLSASLLGLPVEVGTVDCSLPEHREFCYEEHQVPKPPHRPLVKAWRAGRKNFTETPEPGEVLYGPSDMEPHAAMMFIEKVVRLSLADRLSADGLAEGGSPGFEPPEADEEQDPPPDAGAGQPPPPPRRDRMPALQWDRDGVPAEKRALPRPWKTWRGERTAQLTR